MPLFSNGRIARRIKERQPWNGLLVPEAPRETSEKVTTPERYKKLGELFSQAWDLGESDLASFLDRACASDPSLRQELQGLLAFKKRRTEFVV